MTIPILVLVIFSTVFLSYRYVLPLASNYRKAYPHPIYLSENILIADTERERDQGLSGMVSLEQYSGMLFVFPESGYYKFWMKDMLFPLDIIYLDNDMRIVTIVSNIQPESYPETIVSTQPARYVFEMNAGEAVNKGFTVGSILHLKHFIPE